MIRHGHLSALIKRNELPDCCGIQYSVFGIGVSNIKQQCEIPNLPSHRRTQFEENTRKKNGEYFFVEHDCKVVQGSSQSSETLIQDYDGLEQGSFKAVTAN
ncbi:hypothetical protein LJC22_06240 [Desulfosarcina sp. OttesenSCG-928-G10]|nr:hypothetical protein [Desulfosarcina sp. OttesenSCG-928-G10]